MHTAGKKEIDVLARLGKEDPEGKKHICKLLSHFEYKGHLCMVFHPLEMNLRKLLKTYGREVGITLTAIRMYARQMFIGLLHMFKCSVLHGDIKLDNILISKDLKNVAICDYGTADWAHEAVITPYMVSRYYRPPEICLGLKYSFAMDLWSVGVCLFELYTGKFMFTGRNNNEMIKQFLVCLQKSLIFSQKIPPKGLAAAQGFPTPPRATRPQPRPMRTLTSSRSWSNFFLGTKIPVVESPHGSKIVSKSNVSISRG